MTALGANIIRTFVFLVGAVCGSFLGAAAYRLPRGESLVFPRSHCPQCGHTLGVLDLFPILSFIWRRGRCAYCGERISWRYPAIEFITAVLTLLLLLRYGPGWLFVVYVALIYWALLLAAIDIEHHRLLNVLTVPAMALGLCINLAWHFAGGAAIVTLPAAPWQDVAHGAFVDPNLWSGFEFFAPTFSPLSSVLGLVTGGGVLWLAAVISRGGMGGGDVKYLAAVGSLIGPGAALAVLFIACLVGAVVGLGLMAAGIVKRKQPIPFGPFLTTGVIAVVLLS